MDHTMTDWMSGLDAGLQQRLGACRAWLRRAGRLAVAFSGGVDSTFLLALAVRELGAENVLALTAQSPFVPAAELAEARRFREALGSAGEVVAFDPLAEPALATNPPERCYICKHAIFGRFQRLAAERGFAVLASGDNADDAGVHRPGMQAEHELGIATPLLDAGLTKLDIRAASRALGLPTWNKPALACLATRLPYGTTLTRETLARIEAAEAAVAAMGFSQYRVRDHGELARLELLPAELGRALEQRDALLAALRQAGYRHVTLDLQGFRSGSMDETA